MSRNPVGTAWRDMKYRCFNSSHQAYFNYGGRGITVCLGLQDFTKFTQVLGPRPEGYTLDREDNEGSYTCGECDQCRENEWVKNVRWATRSDQQLNRRTTNHTVLYRGVSLHLGKYYLAQIRCNGLLQYVGCFPTAREAAIAYNQAATAIRGANAKINRIRIQTGT